MGRTYAGVLGPISFGTVIARTLIDGGNANSALFSAAIALFLFAAIGYVIGIVAERTVVEAVQMKFRTEWQAKETVGDAQSTVRTRSTVADVAA